MTDPVATWTQLAGNGATPNGAEALPLVSSREFERLALLLENAERGAWTFCLYNAAGVRDAMVAALRVRLEPLPVFEFTLAADRPNPRDYLEGLSSDVINKRAVIVFFDAWQAFGAGFLGYLDLQREQFWKAPHSLVFWIREADRALIARHSPNFFSRHSGVFDFQVSIAFQADTLRSLSAASPATWDSVVERQRQERLFLGLLDEYEADPEPDQAAIAGLLGKLASIWYHSDRFDQAEAALQRRLKIAQAIQDRQIEADSRLQIGRIRQFQDDLAGAGEAYRAALADQESIGARLGAANTRKALGDLALRDGNPQQAVALINDAIQSYREIGDKLGEAGAYVSLGRATDDPGAFERAIAIHTEISSAYDVAVDSYYYGLSQVKLGNPARAHGLLITARDIWQRIGLPQYAQAAQQVLHQLPG